MAVNMTKQKKLIIEILSTLLAVILGICAGLFIKDCVSKRRDLLNAELSFTVTDRSGKSISLSDLPKKPVVINFWAIWCGPCKSELPTFQNAYEKYKDEVTFVFINVLNWQNDTVAEVEEFLFSNGYTFPTYYDSKGEAAEECNVQSIPLTIFMSENGKVQDTHLGIISQSRLERSIKALL